jgi:hypothetical protein
MRLQARALAVAGAVIWAALVLVAGLAHVAWPTYADAFWQLVTSIYPGVGVTGVGSVLLATTYAVFDGGACGLLIAWIYNAVAVAGPVT